MTNGWQDQMVGARMAVDQEFTEEVRASSLSNPQWGLVMTAVEFEIEHPDDPENAELVADTSKLEHVVPEMQSVDDDMAAMGGASGSAGGSGDGVVGGIKSALGLGSDDDDTAELEATAKDLADRYAEALQAHLEDENRWETIRRSAADEQSAAE
jgi:hypothetical protein